MPVHAACICKPVGNDYKVGKWSSDDPTESCNTNYGSCVLSCVIVEFNTATCIQRCYNQVLACNPLENAYIDVGWRIPTFSELIGNIIRLIFFVAGLFALVNLLLGGFEWVQSGGDEKKIEKSRARITASVIGLVVMIAVLSLVVFLEQVVLGGKICLGISCPMNLSFIRLID
ncbi:MAG: pilin [Patescibacteria group bacterium]